MSADRIHPRVTIQVVAALISALLLHGDGTKVIGADYYPTGHPLAGLDHHGRELRGADFSNIDLKTADFSNADLRGANLHSAHLDGANFDGADLREAQFYWATAYNASFKGAVWAFAGHALLLAGVAALARVPAGTILRRMVVEVPFVLFAVLMPFVSRGERTEVLGVSVSVTGLWAAWNLLAKATLGVVTSILLAATTDLRDLLLGLERLRMPSLIVQIMSFMVRYGDVVSDEMRRMRIARESRGFEGRDLRHLPVVARSAGALFVRSYERGERVHLAMLSRGYDGSLPRTDAS